VNKVGENFLNALNKVRFKGQMKNTVTEILRYMKQTHLNIRHETCFSKTAMTLKTKVCVCVLLEDHMDSHTTNVTHVFTVTQGPNKDLTMSSNIQLSLIRMYTVIKIRNYRS